MCGYEHPETIARVRALPSRGGCSVFFAGGKAIAGSANEKGNDDHRASICARVQVSSSCSLHAFMHVIVRSSDEEISSPWCSHNVHMLTSSHLTIPCQLGEQSFTPAPNAAVVLFLWSSDHLAMMLVVAPSCDCWIPRLSERPSGHLLLTPIGLMEPHCEPCAAMDRI